MTVKDHYKTLGVQHNATEDDIKKAYRALAKVWHPDKNKAAGAEEKFKQIGSAYEVLKCKERRNIYDWQFEKDAKSAREKKPPHTGATKTKNSESKFHKSSSFSTFTSATTSDNDSKPKESQKSGEKTKKNKKSRRRFSYAFERENSRFTFSYEDSCSDEDDTLNKKNRKNKNNNDKESAWQRRFGFGKSYTGRPLWEDEDTELPPQDQEKPGFQFNFGFKFYMDSEKGFAFQPDPSSTCFTDMPGFSFDDYSDEETKAAKEEHEKFKAKQDKAQEFGRQDGDPTWYDWSKPFYNDSDEDWNGNAILMTCTYCGRQMNSDMMLKHEPRCRRFSTGSIDFELPRRSSGVRRQEHEDFINMMRQCRKSEKSGKPPTPVNASSSSSTNSLNSDLVMCQYCYRKFSAKVAGKHIQFCQRKMKEEGRPMNPLGKTNAEARDYGSKNYTAREYAKSIPKPGSAKSGRTPHRGSQPNIHTNTDDNKDASDNNQKGDDFDFDCSGDEDENSFPNIFTTSGPGLFMGNPFAESKTGLFSSVPRRKTSIGGTQIFTRVKPQKIDINSRPFMARRASEPNFNAACPNCIQQYGGNLAKFTCSCGTKKTMPGMAAERNQD